MSDTYSFETNLGDGPAPSLLDELRAMVATPLPDETIKEDFRYRPGFTVTYDTRVEMQTIKKSNKKATWTDPKTKEQDLDIVKSACYTLAEQCRGLKRDGVFLNDESGQPLTFKSKMFLDVTNAMDIVAAMKAWFGSDAEILRHGGSLGEASNLGQVLRGEDVNPTTSSTD